MERFSSSLVLCHALVLLLCLAAAAAAGPLSVVPGSVVNDVVEFHAQWTGNPAINSVELPPPGAWAVVSLVQDPPVEVGVGPGATNVAWTVTVSHINGPHAEDVDPNYPLVLRCPPTVGIDYTSPANGGINVKSFTHMTTSPPPYHVDTLQLECRYDWASNTLTITLSTLHHYGDPHLLGFMGQQYEFCHDAANTCKDKTFNLISDSCHTVNTLVNTHAGIQEWPIAGLWMVGYGIRYGNALNLEVAMRTNVVYQIEKDPTRVGDYTRSVAVPGGFKQLLSYFRVNGQDVIAEWMESDKMMTLPGGASIFFPKSKHAHDPSSGPLVMVTTPQMKVTLYIEAADVFHFDFAVTLLDRAGLVGMHGLLGQSLSWPFGSNAAIEGNEMEYEVKEGGLLGTDFKYSHWNNKCEGVAPAATRKLLKALPFVKVTSEGLKGGSLLE